MDPQVASVLFNKAKLAAHLRGLVIMTVGVKAFRDAARHNFAGVEAPKRALLQELAAQLEELKTNDDWCSSGARSVAPGFKTQMLGDNEGGPGLPARDDAQLVLAFTSNDATNAAGKQVPGKAKLVGFVTFGVADTADRSFDSAPLQNLAIHNQILEIDLICTNDAPVGTGSILLMLAIVKELKRKARGEPKYRAVFMDIAQAREKRGGKWVYTKPLERIAERLGFESVDVTAARVDDSNPMVLRANRFGLLANALPDISVIEKLCATRVRNGIPYCV